MALHWDLTRVQNREENYPRNSDGEMNGVTHTLILLTMVVGIGEITEKTAQEFYVRVHFLELLQGGAFMKSAEGDVYFTPQMVRDHIGLSCNVSFETRAKWMGTRIKSYAGDFERDYREATALAAANG